MPQLTAQELEELLEKLEQYKGRATELITVYIPAGQNIHTVSDQLEAEKGTAKNIKSTGTRKNVTNALDKIIRHLKDYKKTPENGLALFSGNVSSTDGQEDLQLWDIETHLPLKVRMYRCDKEFVLDPLREMLEVKEIYGLLVMDRKEATIGMLEGKRIEVLHKMTSGVPSKVKAGGQCLSPGTKIIEKEKGEIELKDVQEEDFIKSFDFNTNTIKYSKVIKKWSVNKKILYEIFMTKYSHIIASADHIFFTFDNEGHVAKKIASELNEKDKLVYQDGSESEIKVINYEKGDFDLIDLEIEDKNFIANYHVVHNSAQRFHRITEGLTKEFYKRIAEEMKKIFFDNPKLKGIIIGGPIPTKDEFIDGKYLVTKLGEKFIGKLDIGGSDESGLKELVQKSQELLADQDIMHEKKLLEKFFDTLGKNPDLASLKEEDTRTALQNGAVDTLILSKVTDKIIVKEFKKIASNMGSTVEIVSIDTEEGIQFKNLSGIGSILRFRI